MLEGVKNTWLDTYEWRLQVVDEQRVKKLVIRHLEEYIRVGKGEGATVIHRLAKLTRPWNGRENQFRQTVRSGLSATRKSYSASRAAPKVRLLGAVQDGNVGGSSILVKNSSNIRTLADLKRRKVAPGSNLRWSVVPCQTVLLGPYAFAAFPVARCQGHHRARRHPLIVLVRSTAGSCTRRIRS